VSEGDTNLRAGQCAQTHRQTHRHTPMTTRPCGLRRAGKYITGRYKTTKCRVLEQRIAHFHSSSFFSPRVTSNCTAP